MGRSGTVRRPWDLLFSPLYDEYHKELEKCVVGHGDTLLDVGCGAESPIRTFSKKIRSTVGVDAHERSVEHSRNLGIHGSYQVMDITKISDKFSAKSFDIVLLSDVIEHLKKEDGTRLVHAAEKIAKKRVIIFTPNGYLRQTPDDDNPHQTHLSGWLPAEMERLGYRITGINGLKFLRTEHARIAWKPRFFWGKVSLLSQWIAKPFPELAFQILCVKDV